MRNDEDWLEFNPNKKGEQLIVLLLLELSLIFIPLPISPLKPKHSFGESWLQKHCS
jgi:hypothetical protein